MKPGVSVSTTSPSKSKTIAARVPSTIDKPRNSTLEAHFEKLVVGKEALQFSSSVPWAVGSMNHIEHYVPAEIASDRSFRGFARIGRTHQFTDQRHRIFTGQRQGNHRAGLHKGFELWIKRPVQDMSIMFGQLIIRQEHHLAANNL